MATALIITDMLNRYEHDDADRLIDSVAEILPRLRALIAAAREAELLVVYVNDNHGDWTAGRDELAAAAMDGAAAYVRHFEVVVPRDAVAHIHEDLARAALRMMRINMRAETPLSEDVLSIATAAER